MREIRQSGSEGGGAETNRLSLPLFPEFSHNLSVGGIATTHCIHPVSAVGMSSCSEAETQTEVYATLC
jgi:hypothetical protein